MTIRGMTKAAMRRAIRAAWCVPALKRLIEEQRGTGPALDPAQFKGHPWTDLDRVFTFCRRELRAQPAWRYGVPRVLEVAWEGYEAIRPHLELRGKAYCDLGCGVQHPFGIAAVMYLNGAASCLALDLEPTSRMRAAEALGDLVADFRCFPERWNWSGQSEAEFLTLARRFDLAALQAGRLDEGLVGLPLRHVVTDIHSPDLEPGSLDVMTSRAVLEHFMDFDLAALRLFELMRPGGVACHHIDLVDHRAYFDKAFHFWSFLAEEEGWSDGLINTLRFSEIRPKLERAGFEILRYEPRRGKMPPGFMPQVKGRFRAMSEEELSVTGVFCVIRKP